MTKGVRNIRFSHREIAELKIAVEQRVEGFRGKNLNTTEKQTYSFLISIQNKLNGCYRCKHCGQWVGRNK